MAVERICAPHMRMRSAATGDAIEKALLNTVACGMKLPERPTSERKGERTTSIQSMMAPTMVSAMPVPTAAPMMPRSAPGTVREMPRNV